MIILLAEQRVFAQYTALLLSNHLSPQHFKSAGLTAVRADNNYFLHPDIELLFANDELSNAEKKDYLKLLLTEGLENGRLWGLCLPWQEINMLQDPFFAHAHVIHITSPWQEPSPSKHRETTQPQQIILPNKIDVASGVLCVAPLLLLERIAEQLPYDVVSRDTIRRQDYLTIPEEDDFPDLNPYWQSPDIKLPALTNKITWVFTSVFPEASDWLWHRIRQLASMFDELPELICFVSESALASIQQSWKNTPRRLSLIQWICQPAYAVQDLDKMLQSSEGQIVVFDDLQSRMDVRDLLFLSDGSPNRSLSFNALGIHDIPRKIDARQVLLGHIPAHLIFIPLFQLPTFLSIDQSLDTESALWDYCIQFLLTTQQQALALPLAYWPDHHQSNAITRHSSIPQQGHLIRERYSASLNVSEQEWQEYLLQTGRQLLETENRLIELSARHDFAREEVQAFQDLTTQLQQRIQHLERSGYYRLYNKMRRLYRLFFKKKAPGQKSWLRVFTFLRFLLSKAGAGLIRKMLARLSRRVFLWLESEPVQVVYPLKDRHAQVFTYHDWILRKLDRDLLQNKFQLEFPHFTYQPLISILMPVYNPPVRYLKAAIESVRAQQYPNWELCMVDDASPNHAVRKLLSAYSAKDPRIKVHFRKENGHISRTSQDALELSQGEFVVLLDHDDLLSMHCLFELVKALQHNQRADLVYSDEDKINEQGIHEQVHCKPDWSPDNLLSRNYIGHVVMLRRQLLMHIGGFRIGYEGSQDYDVLLRFTEQCRDIVHVPQVLYHWRIHTASAAQGEEVKPYAYLAARKALQDALTRRNLQGDVYFLPGFRGYKIQYQLPEPALVSILIPTKDQTTLLQNTIDSILKLTRYPSYEIIVLNNNSQSDEFKKWAQTYSKIYADRLSILEAHFPFNFAKLMNLGASAAKGKYLLMLNNDVEVIQSDWLDTMVSYVTQNRIGVAGAKLLYPDDTIQHAGVIIGLGGIAGHAFVGAYKDDPGYFNYIQTVNNFSALTAACLLCRKTVFEEVGGMDERFEVEYNDVDFCLRLMDAGYQHVYLPQVELYHFESATRGHPHQSKASYAKHLHEMDLFKQRWQHRIDHDPHYNPNLNRGTHDFSLNFSA